MITPQGSHPELAKAVGVASLYLKREDLHPYGSHKGRSIPYMIDTYSAEGIKHFAISSSGNAALAAALHIQNLNKHRSDDISLDVYAGEKINIDKEKALRAVKDARIEIMKVPRPLQSLQEAVRSGKKSLRQSTDDTALVGYFDLARELTEIPHLGGVFVATSSGTTAEALLQAFEKKSPGTQVHIVQTTSCHPIAELFETAGSDEPSIADAIVDRTAFRKPNLVKYIKRCKGHGWIASNESIRHAQELIKKHAGVTVTGNGALALAGLLEAKRKNYPLHGTIACIVGGK